jgi:hypothetical protein
VEVRVLKPLAAVSLWIFLVGAMNLAPASAHAAEDFFERYRSALVEMESVKLAKSRKILDRYNKLYARLSVFAIQCDRRNSAGLNTQVSRFGKRNFEFYRATEKIFGRGRAEDRFEELRNEVANEIGRLGHAQLPALCAASSESFSDLVDLNPSEVKELLSAL